MAGQKDPFPVSVLRGSEGLTASRRRFLRETAAIDAEAARRR